MKHKSYFRLWFFFTGIVLVSIFATTFLVLLLWVILHSINIVADNPITIPHVSIFPLFVQSLIIGSMLVYHVGKRIIHPIVNISHGFSKIAKGNFNFCVPTNSKIEEIKEISEKFNKMTFDLSHIETLRTDFVVNVSHEIKTPIAAIEGYATLLQDPNLTKESHDYYVEKILNNTRILTELSHNILTLSKLENQEVVLENEEYRLDEQLREVILMLESKWEKKNITFEMELENITYVGAQSLLSQVWLNIFDNAIKHSSNDSVIEVSIEENAKEKDGFVCVSIRDFGEGMSESVKKHIFEKFYQADDSRTKEGNGLGLALVKRIVDLAHGEIEVNSEVGSGSEFKIYLPNQK